ncbi:MAG: MmcQ/YjbR family DNA-binding protein [Streptosporangiaceae bacterium]
MTAPGSRRDRILAACGAKPGSAEDLRARYAITPGYHLNKRHWNTVELDDSVPDEELLDLIDHSYDLVVASLTKAQRDSLPRP